jgi:hypothetical protein
VSVRVVINEGGFTELAADAMLAQDILRVVDQDVVGPAKRRAPRLTGAGAASIHAETVFDGGEWVVRAAWDQMHYYMSFHELGTRTLPARPFLTTDLEGLR